MKEFMNALSEHWAITILLCLTVIAAAGALANGGKK